MEKKYNKKNDDWLNNHPIGIMHKWLMGCERIGGVPDTKDKQNKYLNFVQTMTQGRSTMENETRIKIAEIIANGLKASKHENSIFVPVQMLTTSELYELADKIIRGISQ